MTGVGSAPRHAGAKDVRPACGATLREPDAGQTTAPADEQGMGMALLVPTCQVVEEQLQTAANVQ